MAMPEESFKLALADATKSRDEPDGKGLRRVVLACGSKAVKRTKYYKFCEQTGLIKPEEIKV